MAHTRLSNRAKRPTNEHVHDLAHQSLVREVQEIEMAREALQQQLEAAQGIRRGTNEEEKSTEGKYTEGVHGHLSL